MYREAWGGWGVLVGVVGGEKNEGGGRAERQEGGRTLSDSRWARREKESKGRERGIGKKENQTRREGVVVMDNEW